MGRNIAVCQRTDYQLRSDYYGTHLLRCHHGRNQTGSIFYFTQAEDQRSDCYADQASGGEL